MRKIIGGKVYDTETARHIVSVKNGSEVLYRKKTGEFFFLRNGEIMPTTYGCAIDWGRIHHVVMAVHKAANNKLQVQAWISESLKKRIDAARSKTNSTMAVIVERGVIATEKLIVGNADHITRIYED